MAITAQEVNKLRSQTGAGMMDCKKALEEANGDFEVAVDILRKKGQKVSVQRAGREATEGSVFVRTSADLTKGVIVALNCETDFVAKNDEFLKLGNLIADFAAANTVGSPEDLKNSTTADGRTIADHMVDLVGKIGEKIEISSIGVVTGEKVVPYIHSNSKLGVLVALNNTGGKDLTDLGKDLAMQIAAMSPVAIDKDGVDADMVQREIEIGKEQARAEGKPEAMLEKIALGKLNKFYSENTLLNQPFVKDSSKTVAQLLKEVSNDLQVAAFQRISVSN